MKNKTKKKPEFTTTSAGLHHQPQVKLKYFLHSIEEDKTVKTFLLFRILFTLSAVFIVLFASILWHEKIFQPNLWLMMQSG